MSRIVFSHDPVIASKNLRWLEAFMLDDKAWLDDATTKSLKKVITDWAYDAEDALDEWRVERLRAEVEGRRTLAEVDSSLLDTVNTLLKKRETIWKKHGKLPLEGAERPQPEDSDAKSPPESPSPRPKVHEWREEDLKELIDVLLGAVVEEEKYTVLVILGGPDLLQEIYRDKGVSKAFWPIVRVDASGGRQMIEVMREIVVKLTGEPCTDSQVGAMQDRLNPKIDGLKFLLVLDDVRYQTVGGGQWENLCSSFQNCANGSVVMLSTQEAQVSERLRTPPFSLEPLSCWSVFEKQAFSGSRCIDHQELEKIGRKIAAECQGSPLVAKALGQRLCKEREAAVWQKVLEAKANWHEEVPELRLSYHHLPAHLKRCFVYCSMFPDRYLYNREDLVRLWIAHRFIKEEKGKSLEETGLKYFDDLLLGSFFLNYGTSKEIFVIPYHLYALAKSISNGECVTTKDKIAYDPSDNDLQIPRHLSFTPGSELPAEFQSIAKHLRSFVVVPSLSLTTTLKIGITSEAFEKLDKLRALDLSHADIKDLPSGVSKMKHLRYLNLLGSKIDRLDASVFRQLYSLQSLNLGSTDIKELPDTVGNLGNLLHLCLNDTKITKLPEPSNLSKLDSLHLNLTRIVELPEAIGNLKCLRFMHLDISSIQSLPESICHMPNLQILILQSTHYEESDDDATANERDLIEKCDGQSAQIADMADSTINCCQPDHTAVQDSSSGCKALPQLGLLPLLRFLRIDGMPLKHLRGEFTGGPDKTYGFPKLETLCFQNMRKWEEWDGVREGDFLSLNELTIFNCPKLKEVLPLRCPLTEVKVKIERCAVKSIPVAGSVKDLEVIACDNLENLDIELESLCNLTLMYCKNLTGLPQLPETLENVWIEDCKNVGIPSAPNGLKILQLSSATFIGDSS